MQTAHPQLFSGRITNFLDFLRPRRVQAPHRHFLHQKHSKHRRRPVRKSARQKYPQNTQDKFAQAPVLKHYQPLSKPNPPLASKIHITTSTTTTSTQPTTTPYPIILLTSSKSPSNPSKTAWHPMALDEYPTLFQEVTPPQIKKHLEELSTHRYQDGKLKEFLTLPSFWGDGRRPQGISCVIPLDFANDLK